LLINLFVIGVVIALEPIPLASYLIVLPSKRGVVKGAAFLLGWMASLAIVVVVTVSATGNNPPRTKTAPSLAALAVKVAIGAVLVYIAVRRRRQMGKPKPPKKPPKWQAGVDNMSPWYAMGLATLVQPWGLIAAGSATIVDAKLSSAATYLALLGFCLLGSSSYIALELYSVFRPEKSSALLAAIRGWINEHTDQVIVIGALLVGLWFIGDSLYLIVS
jgi:threonine/homoserine/homoserine lactone efflux protein